jgi:hypothetical protein
MKKWSFVALLLVGATILGATVLREPIASAAQGVSATIVGPLDAGGNVRVHEQGTVDVNVTNGSLRVAPTTAANRHFTFLNAAAGATDADFFQAINASLITITSMKGGIGQVYVGDGLELLVFRIEPGHDLVLPLTQLFRVSRIQVDCGPTSPPVGCEALVNIVGTGAS